jgi:hypothetical protein
MSSSIEASSLQIHTIYKAAIFRLFSDFLICNFIIYLEFEVELIYSNYVLSCIVLKGTSEESLREEESGDPKHSGSASIYPLL